MQDTNIHINTDVLVLSNLSIGYNTEGSKKVIAKDLNIALKSGQLVALLGENGSGKSTLIRTLCNLQSPLNGSISIGGKSINQKVAKSIAVVLTSAVYAPNYTVYDMVSAGRYPYTNWLGKLSAYDDEIIKKSIESVSMSEFSDRLIHSLSDGEHQRMMIAKALAQQSDIIILDEPTAHLDLINRVEITKLLQKLAKEENKAILMATHELDLALQMADRLWLMSNGALEEGAPEDMVINGVLQKVFAKLSLDFDHLSGGFKIKTETTKSIHFESTLDTNEEIWTKRALHRIGYTVENNINNPLRLKYIKSSKKWILSNNGVEVEFFELGKLLGNI